jgi:hypothetical protein
MNTLKMNNPEIFKEPTFKTASLLSCDIDTCLPNWDLKSIKEFMMYKHNWNETRVDLAIEEYRKFAFLAKFKHADDYTAPPGDVDDIWHEHILSTKKYSNDTEKYFGYYFHHGPSNIDKIESYDFKKYKLMYNRYFDNDEFMNMFPKSLETNSKDCCARCDTQCMED